MPTAMFLVGIKSKLSDRLVTGMEVKCKIQHYYGDGKGRTFVIPKVPQGPYNYKSSKEEKVLSKRLAICIVKSARIFLGP